MPKVIKIENINNNTILIKYSNGELFVAKINLENLASLIENEYNAFDSKIALTNINTLSKDIIK